MRNNNNNKNLNNLEIIRIIIIWLVKLYTNVSCNSLLFKDQHGKVQILRYNQKTTIFLAFWKRQQDFMYFFCVK